LENEDLTMHQPNLMETYPHLKHCGSFFVTDALILASPEVVRAVLGCCVVLEADHFDARSAQEGGGIRYLALCGLFDEHTGPMAQAPYYASTIQAQAPDVPCMEVQVTGRPMFVSFKQIDAAGERAKLRASQN
jgi:hypothetical protein